VARYNKATADTIRVVMRSDLTSDLFSMLVFFTLLLCIGKRILVGGKPA
jgi:hypothetical protein